MRGVWIEIATVRTSPVAAASHSPCGECGLKCRYGTDTGLNCRHSPCGECGLKSLHVASLPSHIASLPMRGVWIEITAGRCNSSKQRVTPHAGSVD